MKNLLISPSTIPVRWHLAHPHTPAIVKIKTNRPSSLILAGLILIGTAASLPPRLTAAQLAFAPSGATAQPVSTLQVELGTRFSLTQPLSIAGLAYYDFGSDGFAAPHAVTLWNDVGLSLASVTVSSSSPITGPSFGGGQFRFANLALTLQPGTYRLSGALAPIDWLNMSPDPDLVLFDNSAPDGDFPWAAPGITYIGRVYAPDGSAAGAFPSLQVTGPNADDWFGPNLILATEVPEPSALVLMLLSGTVAWRSVQCRCRVGQHRQRCP